MFLETLTSDNDDEPPLFLKSFDDLILDNDDEPPSFIGSFDDLDESSIYLDLILKRETDKSYKKRTNLTRELDCLGELDEDFNIYVDKKGVEKDSGESDSSSSDQESIINNGDFYSPRNNPKSYSDFSTFMISYLLGEISLSDYLMVGNAEEEEGQLMTAYLIQCMMPKY